MTDTLRKLGEVFADVFEIDDLVIDRTTTAQDIEDWDSVMHVTLMLHVEQAFGLRFSSGEIADLTDVGGLVDLIEHKRPSCDR